MTPELEALRKENAALLVAIEAKDAALKKIIGHDQYVMFQRCPDCDYNCAGTCKDMPISTYGEMATEALTISPSTELLETRDRKRDAKLLTVVVEFLNDDFEAMKAIEWLTHERESGEWIPELGD